jgi:hypothetical protein
MGILLGILFLNASISFYEITKAGDAVAALKVIKSVIKSVIKRTLDTD